MCLLFVGGSLNVNADESIAVYTYGSDDPLQKTALADIVKLTIDDNAIVIHTTDKKTSGFDISEVRSIKFDGLVTGIEKQTASLGEISLWYRDGYVGVDGWTGSTKGDVALYDIGGRKVISYKGDYDGAPIRVASLDKGVYIFKVNNNTMKFILQ